MKVRCSYCEHESSGFCTKKTNNSKPIKISLNKDRVCSVYKEDGLRVLTDYRKAEAHKKNLKNVQARNLQIHEAIQKAKEDLASRKRDLTLEVKEAHASLVAAEKEPNR